MSGVRVEARKGRYDLCNPQRESWMVTVRGLRSLLAERVPEFAAAEWFSLSIPESKADEVEGEEGYQLLYNALAAQAGWWVATDKKPAAELLRLLDEDEVFSGEVDLAILLSQLEAAERRQEEAEKKVDELLAKKARIDARLVLAKAAGGAA